MSILESLPEEYYEACIHLPFHEYTGASTPVNALNKEAEALLWHQRLIHCGPHSLKGIHNHVDGVTNLSSFKFDDLLKCPTCLNRIPVMAPILAPILGSFFLKGYISLKN
jgi:hypothetical protein